MAPFDEVLELLRLFLLAYRLAPSSVITFRNAQEFQLCKHSDLAAEIDRLILGEIDHFANFRTPAQVAN